MAPFDSAKERAPVSVPVWDLPVRLFHWLLVLLVIASALTGWFAKDVGSQGMEWHKRSGYAILTLVLFRIGWGFTGSTYARFANFIRGPRAVTRHVGALMGHGSGESHAGHNPLGGWSVVLMLISLAVQTGSGLFLADEDLGVEAPLAKYVSNATVDMLHSVHAANFYIVIALIAIHVLAIAFYLTVKRENLLRPMFTGRKALPPSAKHAASRGGSPLLAAALLMIAIAIVYGIAQL